MERMSCSGLEFTRSSRCCLLLARKSCMQMARSKEGIGASIFRSQGIFDAASIAVLHVHVCAGLLFGKNHAPFGPQRSYVAALLCTRIGSAGFLWKGI
jgi:hypothetical protein